jgi:hypothetical protein
VLPNELDKDCIEPAPMLEKKRRVALKRRSAHRILWICSGLSTAEPASNTQKSSRSQLLAFSFQIGGTSRQRSSPASSFGSCKTFKQKKLAARRVLANACSRFFCGMQTCNPVFSQERCLSFFCQTARCSIRPGSSFGQARARAGVHREAASFI